MVVISKLGASSDWEEHKNYGLDNLMIINTPFLTRVMG